MGARGDTGFKDEAAALGGSVLLHVFLVALLASRSDVITALGDRTRIGVLWVTPVSEPEEVPRPRRPPGKSEEPAPRGAPLRYAADRSPVARFHLGADAGTAPLISPPAPYREAPARREEIPADPARAIAVPAGEEVRPRPLPEDAPEDEEGAFTGSIKDPESTVKFNAETGLYWKEYE